MKPETIRRPDGVIVTTCSGRILVADVKQWGIDYDRLRGGPIWIFYAEEATGYEPKAVDVCTAHFKRAIQTHELKTILVVLRSRMVRMGARLVAMLSKIDMRIYDSRVEADREALVLLKKK